MMERSASPSSWSATVKSYIEINFTRDLSLESLTQRVLGAQEKVQLRKTIDARAVSGAPFNAARFF